MTKEEALTETIRNYLESGVDLLLTDDDYRTIIKVLEQEESCEDCISRQDVLDIIDFEDKWLLSVKGHTVDTTIAFSGLTSKVKALSSVASLKKVRKK